MSQTSLTRTESRNSLYNKLTPAALSRQQSTSSSSPSAVTSVLPKLSLTPQKAGTLQKQQQQQPSPAVTPSTPGQWQHPRMDEVLKRQNATNFDGSNIRIIGQNTTLLLISFLLPILTHSA